MGEAVLYLCGDDITVVLAALVAVNVLISFFTLAFSLRYEGRKAMRGQWGGERETRGYSIKTWRR